MGPRFFSAEGRIAYVEVPRKNGLQWGRASSARKARCARHATTRRPPFNGAALLQRGRRGRDDCRLCQPKSFNGAALLQRGRHCTVAVLNTQVALQWGRASSARKARCSLVPSSRVTSFNGAALLQRGRLPHSQRKVWAAVREAAPSMAEIEHARRSICSARWAITIELPKNASIPGTSFHHPRTRGPIDAISRTHKTNPIPDADPLQAPQAPRWAA